jgi:serine/threonine protein kinase
MARLSDYLVDLSDYTRVRRIGDGATSFVYEYRHNLTGISVAVKKISFDKDGMNMQLLFFREITIALGIQHPTVLGFIGYSLPSPQKQSFYIVTEFLPNGTVETLEENGLTIGRDRHFKPTFQSIAIFGVAVGMRFLHSMNICHRDLKAGNVFLDSNYEPKIGDFGFSKSVDKTLVMSTQRGTPYYMAPEIFNNTTSSSAIDVYAYAVFVLSLFNNGYFEIEGSPPLASLAQLITEISSGKRYTIPESVDPWVRLLIEECWVTAPHARPTFDQIVDRMISDGLVVTGTNAVKFQQYKDKILAWQAPVRPDDEVLLPDEVPFNFT